MPLTRPITYNTLKELLPFAILLVSVTLSWGSITTQQALNSQKIDLVIAKQEHIDDQLDTLTTQINGLALNQTAQEVRLAQIETLAQPLLSKSQ